MQIDYQSCRGCIHFHVLVEDGGKICGWCNANIGRVKKIGSVSEGMEMVGGRLYCLDYTKDPAEAKGTVRDEKGRKGTNNATD